MENNKNYFETKLSISDINSRIKKEICNDTLSNLLDEKLLDTYKDSVSVKNKLIIFENVIQKHIKDEKIIQNIINDLLLEIIPAGTKGVIRGNKFNDIIKNYIINLHLDQSCFEICFEKKCKEYFTDEIPDWYILEKSTNKIIIGMNQLDLWSGGHQTNRGSKYLKNNKYNTEFSKLICVICNKIQLKSDKNKAYEFFDIGFRNNTLCYLNNLKNIIINYFN